MPSEQDPPAIAQSRTSRSRVILNTVYSVGTYVLYLPVNLLVSRFVVHQIGLASFGVWATLTTIMQFGSLLDLGFTTPLIKYVAEYMALGRHREVNALLSTGLVFYLTVSSAFIVGMTLASGWVMTHLFHVPSGDTALLRLYFAVVIGFSVSLTFSVLQSLLLGLQRADILSRISFGFNMAGAAGTVLVLEAGLGVNGLALNWAVVTLLTVVTNWIVAKRLFRPLALNPFLFTWSRLKTVLQFSTKVQVTTVTLIMNDQVDRTLIAYALGPTSLGLYQLASRAASAVRGVSFSLMSGVMPAASDLSAMEDQEKLRWLTFRSTRYLAIVDIGMCFGVASLSGPLVWAWLGPGYNRVAQTMIIIFFGYAIWLPSQAITDPLNGIGRPEVRMRADLAFLLLHIPLSALLIWRFGYFGTVIGTTIALGITRLYIYRFGPSHLGLSAGNLFRHTLLPPAVAGALAAAAAIAFQLAVPHMSYVVVAMDVCIFGLVYASYILIFGFDAYDRQLARQFAGRVVHSI